jgi:hypothetical protein
MENEKQTMAIQAVAILRTGGDIPKQFQAKFCEGYGGPMEYVDRLKDGSYIGYTPACEGGFDYWAYEIGYFD